MKPLGLSAVVAAWAILVSSTWMSAHHSTAMYDASKPLTLRASVTEFRWINPHVYISVISDPKPGDEPVVWVLEASSPGNMTRLGWNRTVLQPKQRVEVEFNPMRDGTRGGLCRKFILLDKQTELTCTGAINAGEKANLP